MIRAVVNGPLGSVLQSTRPRVVLESMPGRLPTSLE
jgi:hypothetical protein